MTHDISSSSRLRFDSGLLVLWLLMLASGLWIAPVFAATPRAVHTGDTLQTAHANWMRWVPDSIPISILSIPGTHDTMARYGGGIAETQSLPLLEQLRAGIRTIDIRARHIEDRFAIHHGIIFQNVMFGDVLIDCNTFLAQNPSETIFMWLSADGVPAEEKVTRPYSATFRWYRDESGLGNRMISPASSTFDIPMGDVRGKIVIIPDFACLDCGLDPGLIDQNESPGVPTAFDMPAKWEAVLLQALRTDAGASTTMYENSLSGGTGGVWPIDLANGLPGYDGMNYRYLNYLFTGNQRRTTGLIYLDFPGSALIGAILAHNMKFATNLSAIASDFSKIVNDISYSATHDGDDQSADHSLQIQNFLKHILPDQHWSVLVSGNPGIDNFGLALEPEGLFGQSGSIDGYVHVAVNSRNLNANITNGDILGFLTPNALTPLSGDAVARAAGAKALLKAHFPQARWNVAVQRAPFDASHWSARLEAAASGVVPVVDDGSSYLYTAWATSASNRAPVAIAAGPLVVNEGTLVTLDAGQSTDPDGDALQYRWDFDGDGTWDTDYLPDPTIAVTFPDNQTRSVRVEAFDGVSGSVAKVDLTVLNVAPTIKAGGPVSLGSDGRLLRQCTILDPGTDSWNVDVSYGDGTPRSTFNPGGKTFTLEHQFPASGYFLVAVDVRDDDGALGTVSFRVVTGAPTLGIQRTSKFTAQLSWSNHPAPFRLESSTQLPGGNWQTVPRDPLLLNGQKRIDLEFTNLHEIFRLAVP